jgi:hypothetical protein
MTIPEQAVEAAAARLREQMGGLLNKEECKYAAREALAAAQPLMGVERDALPPLRAREEIDALVKFARWAISEGSWQGNDLDGGSVQDMAEKLGLLTKTKYDPAIHSDSEGVCEPGDDWFVFSAALSRTAGQEWRDRIGEALLPFGLLARRYDHHKAPDDEIVRSHGTLGKPGDRGYTHITVSDLRRAAALLDELAAAGPIVAEQRRAERIASLSAGQRQENT